MKTLKDKLIEIREHIYYLLLYSNLLAILVLTIAILYIVLSPLILIGYCIYTIFIKGDNK